MNEAAAEREVHLLDYWRILAGRRWAVLTLLAVTFFTVTLHTLLRRPMYTATARLQIERAAPNVLPFQEITGFDSPRDFYKTQYELIRSRHVARDVVRSLRLNRQPEFREEHGVGEGAAEEAAEARQVDRLLKRLKVQPIRDSALVDISFTAFDPELAARVANRVAEAYIAFNSAARYNTTERATTSLAHQIANLQEEIDEKEKELQAYAREHGIVRLGDQQDIQIRSLSDLQAAYSRAQTERIEAEAKYAALRESDTAGIPEVAGSALVQDLAAKSADLARRYAQLSETYKPDWPEMARLRKEIDANEARLGRDRQEIQAQVVQGAESGYRAARAEEESLRRALEGRQRRIQDLQLKEIRYNNLGNEIENRRATLEALVKRQTETSSSIGLNDAAFGNIRIVDPAEVPRRPSAPNLPLNLALGAILGLLFGAGSALFLHYLDRSVKDAEEMSAVARVACMGRIPVYRAGRRRGLAARRGEGPAVETVAHADPTSAVSEAFREIRTSLLVSRPGGPPRTVLVTSPVPGEGKTVVALNLAAALAEAGRRVLLVDADLRRPRLETILGVESARGLTHYLSSSGPLRVEPVATGIPGLDLVPSGPLPPNPADLLDSARFEDVLREVLAKGYDHVLLDAPPVLPIADSTILSQEVEAVLLVVRAGVTTREALADAGARLRQVQASLLGGILNQVDLPATLYWAYGYRDGAAAGEESARSR